MRAELVQVTTRDAVELSGAYFASEAPRARDAVVFLHGDGGHFYAPFYLGLAAHFAAAGLACVSANRRGHDLVAHGARDGSLAGYAFESVADAEIDLGAWIDFLIARGHTRIVLAGHSGGAVRVVYAQAKAKYRDVTAVIAVSPGEYRHQGVIDCHGEAFLAPFREAAQQVAQGQGDRLSVPGVPWGSMWSARAYVDCFNEDDRYSVTDHAGHTGCPTLFVFGAAECDGPERLPVCALACRLLGEAMPKGVCLEVIAGANHRYHNCEMTLYDVVTQWTVSVLSEGSVRL